MTWVVIAMEFEFGGEVDAPSWRNLDRAPGQKKGQGDAINPALTTAYQGGTKGDAVLKLTFAEVLRSCSRNISPLCCGVCVTHAVGQRALKWCDKNEKQLGDVSHAQVHTDTRRVCVS